VSSPVRGTEPATGLSYSGLLSRVSALNLCSAAFSESWKGDPHGESRREGPCFDLQHIAAPTAPVLRCRNRLGHDAGAETFCLFTFRFIADRWSWNLCQTLPKRKQGKLCDGSDCKFSRTLRFVPYLHTLLSHLGVSKNLDPETPEIVSEKRGPPENGPSGARSLRRWTRF
jgi:hypothetical protein